MNRPDTARPPTGPRIGASGLALAILVLAALQRPACTDRMPRAGIRRSGPSFTLASGNGRFPEASTEAPPLRQPTEGTVSSALTSLVLDLWRPRPRQVQGIGPTTLPACDPPILLHPVQN